jgi:Putative transposase of IS4/5 family (DUF4096)
VPIQTSVSLIAAFDTGCQLCKKKKKAGRPRMNDKKAMSVIFYVLRTDCQWNALPRTLGASSTVHDRFSWMNRFRRLLIRWEKKVENYEVMLHFACA